MLKSKFTVAVALVVVFGIPGFGASGKNHVSYKIQGYHENNLSTILTNLLGFGLSIGEKWHLEGNALIDAVTAASRNNIHGISPGPDGITSATEEVDGITAASETAEFRKVASGTLSFTHDFMKPLRTNKNNDDPATLSVFGSYSTERDYLSRNIGGSISQDLFQRNTTVALRFGRNYDKYLPDEPFVPERNADEGWEYFGNGERLTDRGSISLTQGLTITTVSSLYLEFAYDRGYLSRPYYTYSIDDALVHETLPPTRRMINAGIRLNQYVPILSGTSVQGGYRYYSDSWEMQSHTATFKLNVRALSNVILSPTYRYYTQTHAFFYKDVYRRKPRYLTTDFKHGPLNTHSIGLKLRFETNRIPGTDPHCSSLFPSSFDIAGRYLMRSSVTDVSVRNSHYEVWPISQGFRAFWIQAGFSLAF